jgi:GntR family transcriptional regulator
MLKKLKNKREALVDPLSGSEPLYKQVKARIIESLTADEWKPGSMIPSETRLAERYGVGISTIRAAIGELVAARVLVRKQGKGTFVSPHTDQRSIYQFFHVVKNDGLKELPISELVWLKKGKPEDRAADLLRLPRATNEVFKIRNILRVSGRPIVVSDITIPASLFRGLTESIIKEGGKTLYALYQSKYGINIISTTEELRAVKAEAGIAKLLGLSAGTPVLEVSRVAYTFGKTPVEVRRGFVNTSDFHYFIAQGEE